MASKTCCALYRGSLLFKNINQENAFFRNVGNAEFTLNTELTEIEQESFQTLGGTDCSVSYINAASLDVILHCFKPENLALAVLGSLSSLEGDTVTDEEHEVHSIEAYIPFNNVPDQSQSIVVKNDAGSVTYVVNEDYALTNTGIRILEGSDIPVDGSEIKVSYTYGNNLVISALALSQQEFEVIFDGFNAASADKTPVKIHFNKVKFSPAASIAFITSDAFANLELSGEILADNTKPEADKFFKITEGVKSSGGY